MALKSQKLTREALVSAGHGRLDGQSVVLSGTGAIKISERGNAFVVLDTEDKIGLWLNTFTKMRRGADGEVLPPTDPFLDKVFGAMNVGTAAGQCEAFVDGLKAIGVPDATCEKFIKGLLDNGTPEKVTVKFKRLTEADVTYFSLTL